MLRSWVFVIFVFILLLFLSKYRAVEVGPMLTDSNVSHVVFML
jgi:hypothetical protein